MNSLEDLWNLRQHKSKHIDKHLFFAGKYPPPPNAHSCASLDPVISLYFEFPLYTYPLYQCYGRFVILCERKLLTYILHLSPCMYVVFQLRFLILETG